MSRTFDGRQVQRAFSRAAADYRSAADLQREIESRLLESLDYLDLHPDADGRAAPAVVLDVGSGPGNAAAAMQRRWPKTRVVALDLSLPMLRQARDGGPRSLREAFGLRRGVERLCADARALPLADSSVDVLFSNLCLQWIDDLPAVFAGFRRVLRPGGLLLCSTFGPDTLQELRDAFADADAAPHVSPFASIAQFGDALMHAGFRDPVLDRDLIVRGYDDLPALMRELRTLGATNALQTRRRTLTGRARFAAATAAYEPLRLHDGRLPASWEVMTAMAWAPAPGAPIREQGAEVASFPADRIPLRKRR